MHAVDSTPQITIPDIETALDLMGTVLVRDFMETPLDSMDGEEYLTPNEIIRDYPMRRILDRIATMAGVDLDKPMIELSGRIPTKICQDKNGDVKVFEALLERLSKDMIRSWCDQSMHAFQGRTANEMLEYEGGELKVIEYIREEAKRHGIEA